MEEWTSSRMESTVHFQQDFLPYSATPTPSVCQDVAVGLNHQSYLPDFCSNRGHVHVCKARNRFPIHVSDVD